MTNKYGTATTTTKFLLWAGNGNQPAVGAPNLRYAGSQNEETVLLNNSPVNGNKLSVTAGYYVTDYNMNGVVRYSGSLNDENILLNVSLLGNKLLVIPQASF